MLFTTTSVAILGFASYASAHMKMASPMPYANSQLDNAPLLADGSNFPCKMHFDTTTPATSMPLGSSQTLKFIGGATHGGGSCQVSITYDNPPTKNSVFKVIHSIEGGCPITNNAGNAGGDASAADPDTYGYTIPSDLPTGKATLAWTWFNKVGNREMYMNCAPIDITGGSAKRGVEDDLIARNETQLMERDQNAYNNLPNMFTANIMNIGTDTCATFENFDVQFPNPGQSVATPGKLTKFGPPSDGCGKAVSGSSGSSGSPSSVAASPVATASPVASGGVFATVAVVSSAAAVTHAPVATSTVAPSVTSAAPVAATTAAAAAAATSAASGSASSGASGSMAPGSACSPEGQWNCIGGTSFQRCASGTWSVVQQLAAGTTCTAGQSAALDVKAIVHKRAIRFSSEHVRRHMHARLS